MDVALSIEPTTMQLDELKQYETVNLSTNCTIINVEPPTRMTTLK